MHELSASKVRSLIAAVAAGCLLSACQESSADLRPDAPREAAAGAEPDTTGATAAVSFTDVTELWGLDFRHEGGDEKRHLMPGLMGGGAAVFDADGDGRADLYLVDSGQVAGAGPGGRNRLFLAQADGTFADQTEISGLGDRGYGMGAAVGDIDNDGDLDLFVSNLGPDAMYRNDGGGRFADVTQSMGVGDPDWSASAVFFDYDLDGYLDLYVTRYVRFRHDRKCSQGGGAPDFCGPTVFEGLDDRLYHNDGGRSFTEVGAVAGLRGVEDAGLGVVSADFDGDGWPDLYVANDADPNNLWMNQRDGTFVDEAVLRGVAFNRFGAGEAGMGVVAGDADGDEDLDLFVTHLIEETNTFYRNLGGAEFEDSTSVCRLASASLSFTGFGTAFFDADNDGDLDLVVANGATKRRPTTFPGAPEGFWAAYAEPNALFLNDGGGRYTDVTDCGGLCRAIEVSRALVPADFDGDGDLDLLVSNIEGPARLYRNDSRATGAWITVRLVDSELRRAAVGAALRVVAGDHRWWRECQPSGGYLSGGEAYVHLGLGRVESIDRFEVRWPGGERETFLGGAANRAITLVRGEGNPE